MIFPLQFNVQKKRGLDKSLLEMFSHYKWVQQYQNNVSHQGFNDSCKVIYGLYNYTKLYLLILKIEYNLV